MAQDTLLVQLSPHSRAPGVVWGDQMQLAVSQLLNPELERHNVPDRFIFSQREKELELLRNCADPPLPDQRGLAIRLLTDVSGFFNSSRTNQWFEALQMVDMCGADLQPCTDFFSHVAAAWFVSTKLSESGSPDHNVKVLSVLANIATGHSKFNGCGEVTADLITRQENLLMRALSFNLSIPTVCTWNASLCARFDVVTKHKITDAIHNLSRITHMWLERLVCQVPSTSTTSPEMLVVGALFCVLVQHGAVHCEEVRKTVPQQTQHVAIGIAPDALKNAFEYATRRTMPEIINFSTMVLKASEYFKIA
uniref:Cyclin N-terminal domain-containing protein n=1 Tax=Noctiluca scintillans TaxID=2966 RepID=A0A7S1A9B2_NOCSC